MNTLSISQARSILPKIIDQASTLTKRTYITVRGNIKAVVMPAEELSSLETTMEILSDPKTMKAIKQGRQDIKKGHLANWEDIKAQI